MKQDEFSTLTVEELNKKLATIQKLTIMLGVILVLMAISGVFITMKRGFYVFTVLPVSFLPILIANVTNAKKIKAEIASRNQ